MRWRYGFAVVANAFGSSKCEVCGQTPPQPSPTGGGGILVAVVTVVAESSIVISTFRGQAGAGCAVFSFRRLDFFAARLHVGKTVFCHAREVFYD